MFESISEKLGSTLKKIKGYGKLREENIQEALREVRLSLLEADVNFKVVREFTNAVKERALGKEVAESLTPGQQFIKIVHEELIKILGEKSSTLNLETSPPVKIMIVGLQGSGKTTTSAKLASFLIKNYKRSPLLVPADVYRPAAIEQLKVLGNEIGVSVYDSNPGSNPVDIVKDALSTSTIEGHDVIIVDTAGRLHIDQELMDELVKIKSILVPDEILLVADAMSGQDAVTVAESFNNLLDISGVVLTKMDGDARGGAALSIKSVTGKPIKFLGVGEKTDALEVFHPERIASRILGMGDVLTLIEKAQDAFEKKKAEKLAKKIAKNQFTLEDFKESILAMEKLGPLSNISEMIPGMKKVTQNPKALEMAEKELKKTVAIINSMTKKERMDHTILNASRRKRIAKGSGTNVQDVNRIIKNYMQMRKMMRNMGKMSKLTKKLMKFI